MEVGFIGTGQMGKHMAKHILEAGFALVVYDVKKEAASHLLEKGAKWADSPKAVAESCRVVISCLPTPQIVEQTVYGKNGLKEAWKKGDIYIDMSTNSPSVITKIAEDAKKAGVTVLDAPVSGGTRGAEAGTLAIMVGGDPASFEKVKKILETMGQKVFRVGDAGCGNVLKLVNNMIGLACGSATAEGFVLGVKAGIDPQVLYDVIKISTGNNWTLQQYPHTVLKRNFEPGFKVSLAYKDINLALNMAKENGLNLPMGNQVKNDLETAVSAGLSDKDVNVVILNLEKGTGIQVGKTE
jgi:2-hydroxymethylglutarate dehydrogenase